MVPLACACVVFASGYHGLYPGVLVSRPLTAFTKALEVLRKHTVERQHWSSAGAFESLWTPVTRQLPDMCVDCVINP